MLGLVSDPGPVLDDVRLVIWTLQSLKEAYSQSRTQLENQNQVQLQTTLHVCVSNVISCIFFVSFATDSHGYCRREAAFTSELFG